MVVFVNMPDEFRGQAHKTIIKSATGNLQLRFICVWSRVCHTKNSSAGVGQICLEFVLERLSPNGLTTYKCIAKTSLKEVKRIFTD